MRTRGLVFCPTSTLVSTVAPAQPKQRYLKPPLSTHDLLRRLTTRGLAISNCEAAARSLETIGYYRLLVYMRPFQVADDQGVRRFVPGTGFEDVLALYEFDRRLRLLCMDAVERIEVALRSAIVCEISVAHGAHFYLDARHFVSAAACQGFQSAVRKEATRHHASRHYMARYDDPPLPPIWVSMEAVTFGTLSHTYSNLALPLRRAVARHFGFDEVVLSSWFRSLTHVRNVAAHHGRLWNASLTADKPLVAKKLREEFGAVQSTFFARAVVAAALLGNMDSTTAWKAALIRLLDGCPHADETRMGFPEGWRARAFWS
jgi:abortive infection bacteriophage resistance protein